MAEAEEKVGRPLVEECVGVAREAVDAACRALALAKLWQRKYRALKRRALARLRDVVAHLEAADGNDPHVQAAREILHDLEHSLEEGVGGK